MHFKFSLAQLFLGITVWSVCLGAVVGSFPSWVYALLAAGAVIALTFLFARLKNLAGIALLSFPIFCLLHWSLFMVGLDYVFGGSGVGKPVGPIAEYVSRPVVILQNSIPLAGLWDTYLGIALVSALETGMLILAKCVWRRYAAPKLTTDD